MQNPFQQQQMMTGAMLGAQAFGQPQMQAQPTGFLMPQQTAMPMGGTNPFGLQPQPQQQPQQQFQPFLAPQQTAFLQPQMTGANPFRQSMLFPQTIGMPFVDRMSLPRNPQTPSPNSPLHHHRTLCSPPVHSNPSHHKRPPQSSRNPLHNHFSPSTPSQTGLNLQLLRALRLLSHSLSPRRACPLSPSHHALRPHRLLVLGPRRHHRQCSLSRPIRQVRATHSGKLWPRRRLFLNHRP